MPRASIVYYTDHHLPAELAVLCRTQLVRAAQGREIVAVGLGSMTGFPVGSTACTLVHVAERGILTMHRQILTGLENATGDIVYLCEHDVLYSPTHFDIVPARADTWTYNVHVWHARYPDGHAVFYNAQQVSGLVAYRSLLLDYYRARIAQIEREGPNRHYEPGLKQSVGSKQVVNAWSLYPNVDVRHDRNWTASKWSRADFRNGVYARGWREADELPGWGDLRNVFAAAHAGRGV